jgi:glutathione-specific gamma-glutamylcyclotransferase
MKKAFHTGAVPSSSERSLNPSLLSRALLEAGGLEVVLSQEDPGRQVLTASERASSLDTIIGTRPDGPVWIFGYGSLMWNPALDFVETRLAVVKGWRRSFCLTITTGRGSTEAPGLIAGLEPGESCGGLAFRLADDRVEHELTILWRREMVFGSYVPKWMTLFDARGRAFGQAIAFTVDPVSPRYAGELTIEEKIWRLATASGSLGTAAEYLFRTRDSLRMHGIVDADLEALAAEVDLSLGGERQPT